MSGYYGYGQQPSEERQVFARSMDSCKEAIVCRIKESAAAVAADRPEVQSAVANFTAAVEYRFNSTKEEVDRAMVERGK